MTARLRCALAACGAPTTPAAARRYHGCCSAAHRAQHEFLAGAQADPPTEPTLARPGSPVSRDADARLPGRGRRWGRWGALAAVAAVVVGLYVRGGSAPVASTVIPGSAPASTSATASATPTPSASRARPPTSRPSSTRRTTRATKTTDPDLAELRSRARDAAARARAQDDG